MSNGLIRNVPQLIGLLAQGSFAEHLNGELEKLLNALEESPADTTKGSLSITLNFKHELGRTDIEASAKLKLPENARFMKTPFWIVDGQLSTQHPKQIDMFAAPRPVRNPAGRDDDDEQYA